jgi:formylglycine-generating enzyme required for sulfatase activity
MMSGKIFISYRREDTAGYAGRIYDRLRSRFGENNIFMDVDSIAPGEDFVRAIERSVEEVHVLIALIGARWLDITDEPETRRLDNPNDFVRIEIATALERGIRVIPVLIGSAKMPRSKDLPDVLKTLARRNALSIRHERFNADVDELGDAIDKVIKIAKVERETGSFPRVREAKAQGGDFDKSGVPGSRLKVLSKIAQVPIGLWVVILVFLVGSGAIFSLRIIANLKTANPVEKTPALTALAAEKIPERVGTMTDEPEKPTPHPTETILSEQSASLVGPEEVATQTKIPTSTLTPSATSDPNKIVDDFGIPMVLVPSGEFEMGSNTEQVDELPVHTIFVDSFYIDQYEVTNIRYQQCVESEACSEPANQSSNTRLNYYGNSVYDNYPVTRVSWFQAKAYCQWRNARLPTEAEWEKAAGGTMDTIYPWGDKIDCRKANYKGCEGDTVEVGSHPLGISPYGVHDMAGNVWEWVRDRYDADYYAGSPDANPSGPAVGEFRVLRGGSWENSELRSRVAERGVSDPNFDYLVYGIRCVADIVP